MEEISSFKENSEVSFLSPTSDKEGKEWDVVLIQAGVSLNNNFYSPDVLKKALNLFEGLKACAYRFGNNLDSQFDHLPEQASKSKPGGFVENVVGWFENVRYGTFTRANGSQGEGVLARFHVFEGAKWLRDNLKDAFSHNQPNLLGFSIDALGRARDGLHEGKRVKFIEEIEKVNSTDIVSQPAAGGAVLRLVASVKGENMENIMNLVKKHRSAWLEGFSGPKDEESMKDYGIRVFEANISNAEKALSKVDVSDVKNLQEAANGLKMLNSITQLMKGGKTDEAMKMLQGFISSNKVTEAKSPYAIPVKQKESEEETTEEPTEEESAEEKAKKEKTKASEEAAEAEADENNETDPVDNDTEIQMEEAAKKKEKELKVRESKLLVKERLMLSGLTEKSQERISKLYEGKIDITAEKIDESIKEEKEYIASFSESGKVEGLGGAHEDEGSIKVTQDQKDKIDLAFDGLFESRDIDGVPRFTSLKTAWGAINGPNCWSSPEQTALNIFEAIARSLPQKINYEKANPYENHKNYLKESFSRIYSSNLREAVTTSDFSATFGDALFRRLQKEYDQDPRNDWRQIVSSIENLTDATNDFTIIRAFTGVNDLPVVEERAPYQELNPNRSENSEAITPAKHGGLEKLTWEDILADRLGAIRRIPRILAQASNRTIHKAVWNEIEANPALSDAVALINATHSNLVSGSPVLSYDAVTAAIQLLRDQTGPDSGEKMGLMPAFLLVGTKLETAAFEITNSNIKANSSEDSTVANAVRDQFKLKTFSTLGLGRVSGTDDHWYVAASPRSTDTIAAAFLGGRDRPDIFIQGNDTPTAGAMFDADEITFKIRLVFGVKVVDHRWIAGSLQ